MGTARRNPGPAFKSFVLALSVALVTGHLVPAESPHQAAARAKFDLLRESSPANRSGNPIRLFEMSPGEFVGLASLPGEQVGSSIFSINSSRTYRTLHDFPPLYAGYSLIQAEDGSLFGDGGLTSGSDRKYSYFSVSKGPDYTIRTFPVASPLVPGVLLGSLPDGGFYGFATTGYHKYSLVAIDRDGIVSTLHSFTESEGIPYRGESLTRNRSGEFTGLAVSSPSGTREAWIYQIDARNRYRRLADVANFEDSRAAPVFAASDGVTYIGIPLGGANKTGTIMAVSPEASVRRLADFPPGNREFARPAFLMEASDGWLYGSNSAQPSSIFRVDPRNGKLELVYAFDKDGSNGTCICRFVQGTDGSFYGVAAAGGYGGAGTVFRLDVGLSAPKRP